MPMVTYAADQTVTSAQTVNATVKTQSGTGGSDDSAFVVAIPQEIELARSGADFKTFTGTYTVGVKAVLASGKKVSVSPATTFDMTGPETVQANVNQTVTKWIENGGTPSDGTEIAAGIDDYVTTTGTITVNIKKAGAYSGTLGFTVALQ